MVDDVRDRRDREITRGTGRQSRQLEIHPQYESFSSGPRGYISTFYNGERKIHYKAPMWRDTPDEATPDFGLSSDEEDPQYQEAGYESQEYVEDNDADLNSQEETLRGTSTRESTLRTEAPRHHLPSKVSSRSCGVSDESRLRRTSRQHVLKDRAGRRYETRGKE